MWIAAATLNQILCNHEKAVKEKDVLFAQFIAVNSALNEVRGENAQLEAELNRRMADVDWMRLRINQLEQANNQLLRKVTGIVLDTPEIEPIGRARQPQKINEQMLNPFLDPEERDRDNQPAEQVESVDNILRRHNVKMPNFPVGQEV